MKSPAWFDYSLSFKPWRTGQLRWMMQDLAGTARQPEQEPRTHLRATLEWLCRAQDACPAAPGSGCVSAGWTFDSGWLPGSIDTTGWLVETLNAKYFADALMMDRVGITIPPDAREKNT